MPAAAACDADWPPAGRRGCRVHRPMEQGSATRKARQMLSPAAHRTCGQGRRRRVRDGLGWVGFGWGLHHQGRGLWFAGKMQGGEEPPCSVGLTSIGRRMWHTCGNGRQGLPAAIARLPAGRYPRRGPSAAAGKWWRRPPPLPRQQSSRRWRPLPSCSAACRQVGRPPAQQRRPRAGACGSGRCRRQPRRGRGWRGGSAAGAGPCACAWIGKRAWEER